MTTEALPARWVLLASAGLACLLLGLAAWWWPEWAAVNFFVPVLLGLGLPPVVALGAGLGLWWASETTRLWLDKVRGEAQRLANVARAAELMVQAVILNTDDDTPEPSPDAAHQREIEVAHWHIFFRRIVAAGMAYGWGRDTLAGRAAGTHVLSQLGWNVGTDQLVAAGFLYKDGAGTRLLVSEADWNAGRLWLKVPCPTGEPPPILPPPYTNSATTRPNNEQTAAGAVVEQSGKG